MVGKGTDDDSSDAICSGSVDIMSLIGRNYGELHGMQVLAPPMESTICTGKAARSIAVDPLGIVICWPIRWTEPLGGAVGRAALHLVRVRRAAELHAVQSLNEWVLGENWKAVQSAIGHLSPSPPAPPVIRHCDELPWGAGLLRYGADGCWIGYAPSPGRSHARTLAATGSPLAAQAAQCRDAFRSTRDNRNPSTAGAPTSPCCSAGNCQWVWQFRLSRQSPHLAP